jgi:hypothetical protein
MHVRIESAIDLEELAATLAEQLDEDALVQFVVDLDLYRLDWSFTEKLFKHFKMEHKIYKAEM